MLRPLVNHSGNRRWPPELTFLSGKFVWINIAWVDFWEIKVLFNNLLQDIILLLYSPSFICVVLISAFTARRTDIPDRIFNRVSAEIDSDEKTRLQLRTTHMVNIARPPPALSPIQGSSFRLGGHCMVSMHDWFPQSCSSCNFSL